MKIKEHSEVRQAVTWGTYGPYGDRALKRKRLEELSDDHIAAILRTQTHIGKELRDVFEDEQSYRVIQGIEVADA